MKPLKPFVDRVFTVHSFFQKKKLKCTATLKYSLFFPVEIYIVIYSDFEKIKKAPLEKNNG